MFHFYTTWKIKNKGFLRFPGGIEMEPWKKKWAKNNEEDKNIFNKKHFNGCHFNQPK